MCCEKYNLRYNGNIEKNWGDQPSPFDLGSRVHELLEERFKTLGGIDFTPYEAHRHESVELEAQATFAAYCAHYPVEPFSVVSVEQTFSVPIAGTEHSYTGKFDGIIKYPNGDLAILEHKTEKRSGTKNLPKSWAARSQVSLYMWAAYRLYGHWPAHILLDVLYRQSPKGQEPPSFHRDTLERTPAQAEEALRDLVWTADQIETLERGRPHTPWPRSTDQCVPGYWDCDFFDICVTGSTPELIQIKYRPAKEYLTL